MAEIQALGVRSIGLEADLTDRAAAEAAIEEIVTKMGRLDIVVANAGGGTVLFADEKQGGEGSNQVLDEMTTGTPSNTPEEMLTRVMDINVKTCMYTCMAATPHLKAAGGGRIVTVSSTAGVDARGAYHPYGMAKAAIIHYTRSLAQELGPFNINVNAIAPGIIRTGRLGDRADRAKEVVALQREGTIEDCAGVVEFLTTDLSAYVTGRTILIDGGMLH
jgi:3-oxoacyl-[acyl-carrier protein] reductase